MGAICCNPAESVQNNEMEDIQHSKDNASAVPKPPTFSSIIEMDEFLTTMIEKCDYPIPGLSIAVITKQDDPYLFNFGVENVETQKKTTSKSLYHLFSGTKLFTATAIMQLCSQKNNNLNLDDSITKYLPNDYVISYTNNIQTRNNLQRITIRNLLTHSCGLKDKMTGFMAVHLPTESEEKEEKKEINSSYSTLDALKKYGEFEVSNSTANVGKVSYCNFGYALLGEIISNSNSYNLSYEQYMKQYIFNPLKMNVNFSYNSFDDAQSAHITTGYIHKYSAMKPFMWFMFEKDIYKNILCHKIGQVQGMNTFELYSKSIGGIIGNIEEIAKFVSFQMNGNDDILDRKYLDEMQNDQMFGTVGIQSKFAVGFGWKVGKTFGDERRFINHEGGGPGFHSEIRIYPGYDCGIVICCNYASVMPQGMAAFMHQICEVVFASMDVIKHHISNQ